MRVGVIGYSGNLWDEKIRRLERFCLALGKALAEEGFIIYNGGRDGVMELVSKGAKEVDNSVVVGVLPFTPSGVQSNPYVDVPVYTCLDFQMRSFVMLQSCEVVVSIGGEIGTAIEILGAYAQKKKLILLKGTGGWTDRFAGILIDGKYLDNRRLVEVRVVEVDVEANDISLEVWKVIKAIKEA